MGEQSLTRIQAGIEVTRGVAVPATRKIYGVLEPHRDQPRRYAIEDRGLFPSYMRANAKLVDASFKLAADATPEDLPYFLDMALRGGITSTQVGTSGAYVWTVVPDLISDTLKTRTLEWGDDSLQYRGAFGIADSLDIKIPLDDAVSMDLNGFVEEWVPVGSEGFTGFTPSLTDRSVETMLGWQQRMFVDFATGIIGTTQVSNRFISGNISWKLQSKRKYFGDGSPRFTLFGRGRRVSVMDFTIEAFDLAQMADTFNTGARQNASLPVERACRIMLIGTPIGTTAGTTTAATIPAGATTSIPTLALPQAIAGGTAIQVSGATGVTFVVAPAGAANGAVTIPVVSQVTNAVIPVSQTIQICKSVSFDFYGYFDGNPNWGLRETNRTFGITLTGVYDTTQGTASRVTVVNGLPTASGIS